MRTRLKNAFLDIASRLTVTSENAGREPAFQQGLLSVSRRALAEVGQGLPALAHLCGDLDPAGIEPAEPPGVPLTPGSGDGHVPVAVEVNQFPGLGELVEAGPGPSPEGSVFGPLSARLGLQLFFRHFSSPGMRPRAGTCLSLPQLFHF